MNMPATESMKRELDEYLRAGKPFHFVAQNPEERINADGEARPAKRGRPKKVAEPGSSRNVETQEPATKRQKVEATSQNSAANTPAECSRTANSNDPVANPMGNAESTVAASFDFASAQVQSFQHPQQNYGYPVNGYYAAYGGQVQYWQQMYAPVMQAPQSQGPFIPFQPQYMAEALPQVQFPQSTGGYDPNLNGLWDSNATIMTGQMNDLESSNLGGSDPANAVSLPYRDAPPEVARPSVSASSGGTAGTAEYWSGQNLWETPLSSWEDPLFGLEGGQDATLPPAADVNGDQVLQQASLQADADRNRISERLNPQPNETAVEAPSAIAPAVPDPSSPQSNEADPGDDDGDQDPQSLADLEAVHSDSLQEVPATDPDDFDRWLRGDEDRDLLFFMEGNERGLRESAAEGTADDDWSWLTDIGL